MSQKEQEEIIELLKELIAGGALDANLQPITSWDGRIVEGGSGCDTSR
jgi:hypothetical protein